MKKSRKTQKEVTNPKGNTLLKVILAILLIASFATISFFINQRLKSRAFTGADWEYMVDYIETKYGNGKKFVVYEKDTDEVTKNFRDICYGVDDSKHSCDRKVTIGYEATIIGNFDGEETGYHVTFKRYFRDCPYKEGNNVIIHTGVNSNYTIEEYKGTK